MYKHPGMAYWRLRPKSRPECFCFEPILRIDGARN